MEFSSLDPEIQNLLHLTEDEFNRLDKEEKSIRIELATRRLPKYLIPIDVIKLICGEDVACVVRNIYIRLVCLTKNYVKVFRPKSLDVASSYNYITNLIKTKTAIPIPKVIKYGKLEDG